MSLKFTEFYWSAAGKRVFDVSIEGKQVLTNFDIFAAVGNDRAYDVSFPVTVTGGQLNLDFRAAVDYAKLSAIVITESPSSLVAAINCRGGEYIDQAGTVYEADRYFDGGWVSSWGWVSGTDDVYLYKTARYGDFSYSIPLANGNYDVVLKFAEVYWNSPGGRVFDVRIEDVKALSTLDIFALAGRNRPYDASLPVTISDGHLNIMFTAVKNYAGVSAIVVLKK